ncbi:MAG: pentapeptide repeat-containing protein [Nitratireductor sp.]|nr:pentapeptide repeat-containing protein [Nitratireductor sp.]
METEMQFEVTNRFTGAVQFVAEIECDENASRSVKLGLAVRWAVKTRANLSGANLSRADLSRADLSYANLSGANLSGAEQGDDRIIDGGLRSDGYRFFLTRTEPGEFRVKAGCRNFTVKEAKAHWDETRPKGEALGDETRLIIKHMLAIAKLREWKPLEAETAEAA